MGILEFDSLIGDNNMNVSWLNNCLKHQCHVVLSYVGNMISTYIWIQCIVYFPNGWAKGVLLWYIPMLIWYPTIGFWDLLGEVMPPTNLP